MNERMAVLIVGLGIVAVVVVVLAAGVLRAVDSRAQEKRCEVVSIARARA